MTGDGVYLVIRQIGEKAGVHVRPHGLRHSGITAGLDATNGNVRAGQKFSRHKDVKTVMRYDDNREDLGGSVARAVASRLSGESEEP